MKCLALKRLSNMEITKVNTHVEDSNRCSLDLLIIADGAVVLCKVSIQFEVSCQWYYFH